MEPPIEIEVIIRESDESVIWRNGFLFDVKHVKPGQVVEIYVNDTLKWETIVDPFRGEVRG